MVSQEDIARQANISVASVSRFIHKVGFASFHDFKHKVEIFNHEIKMQRVLDHTMRFMRQSSKDMIFDLYQDAFRNLKETYEKIDIDLLKSISKRLKSSKQIVVLGDDHELEDFYTFQIDMLINGIPTYMIRINEPENLMLSNLTSNDTILYLELYEGWHQKQVNTVLEKAKAQGIYVIAIAQEKEHLLPFSDLVYQYGIVHSHNDGYYSLPLISRILSELIYHKL